MTVVVVAPLALERFVRAALSAAGADGATTDAAARAMLHGSRLGVDSHGVRLLEHYVTVMEGGRVNKTPNLAFVAERAAVATLDADHAHGALAAYAAMDKATELARSAGIGAVSIRNSSHFGPAGAYALAAAEAGMIGFATCNSDAFVRLHGGARRFHGTNPLAVAVPADGHPWLFDMATSAIPFNRVQLYRSLGVEVPEGTGSDAAGLDTLDADAVEMLAPLGAAFGFKGAGLAGIAEIFSAVLSGMGLSFELLPMGGDDKSTPRGLGAFVMAINPEAFISRAAFDAGMRRYLDALRTSPPRADGTVMAPGDREWAVAEERLDGIPLDPVTVEGFGRLAERYGLPSLEGL
ncbi:Ldh family oxidoreductase [Acuticoccus sp. I52.16.1]|uniref:Ldh family oxidoreductase n=1 Tax=Acuticoccus sp. I52.16.1 TaxID=2928472 RepID=UPI001FD32141|nr:Ldh family oxidoreductase [Acuticoccus sp. I52.16.1]UOM35221.1 Ldh family oxidoreductase [Acuticoccus sp. I52.16.1]